jgi:hypothetical protein
VFWQGDIPDSLTIHTWVVMHDPWRVLLICAATDEVDCPEVATGHQPREPIARQHGWAAFPTGQVRSWLPRRVKRSPSRIEYNTIEVWSPTARPGV